MRNGSADYDDVGMAFPIDNLKYTYSVLNKSNQLIAVVDDENSTEGFNDVNKVGADFVYDSFGNMIMDLNKNITAIKYNHLNLPTQIKFNTDGANEINYLYNAVGAKVGKKVKSTTPGIGVVENKTDYLNGFQYLTSPSIAGKLQFFPTAEGYVKAGKDDQLSYVYNYTDHLGNVRVSYSDLDKNGILGNEKIVSCSEPDPISGIKNCSSYFTSSILEENHYYAFGLEHKGYDYSNSQANYQYKYNGKELQDELGLNVYDYDNRIYDPAIGRFLQMDPLAENGRRWSPYNYCFDNPIYFQDPDGMWPWPSWTTIKTVAKATYNKVSNSLSDSYNKAKKSAYNPKTYNTDIAVLTIDFSRNVVKSINTNKGTKKSSSLNVDLKVKNKDNVNDGAGKDKGDRNVRQVEFDDIMELTNPFGPGGSRDQTALVPTGSGDSQSSNENTTKDNTSTINETSTPEQDEMVSVKRETYMATDFPNNTSRLHKTEKDTTVKASDVSKIDKMNARSKRKAEKERDRINND